MDLKKLLDQDDAVSPVIGVILMVAITVILAAVIATFVLGLGENLSNTAPQATFSFDYDTDLTITHEGGDSIDPNNLYIRGDAQTGAWNSGTIGGTNSDVTAGSSVTITASDGDTVRVTYESEGSSATLGQWEGPTA